MAKLTRRSALRGMMNGAAITVGVPLLDIFLAFFLLGWVAGGDVKLIAAVALWIGPENAGLFVLLTASLGALLALALLLIKREARPPCRRRPGPQLALPAREELGRGGPMSECKGL